MSVAKAVLGQGPKSEHRMLQRVLRLMYRTNCTGLLIRSFCESSASCRDSLVLLQLRVIFFCPMVPLCLSFNPKIQTRADLCIQTADSEMSCEFVHDFV